MGLFDKKFCDICGEKIRFLGNHKLEDGNMCGTCNKKMSPYFSGRRKTTVAEMKEHLAEREANVAKVEKFVVNAVYGENKKVYIDTVNGNFCVSYANQAGLVNDNPDILPLSAVTRCDVDVKETREEEFTKDANGNRVSYQPPRYRYFYAFRVIINLNWRWFDQIEVDLNNLRSVEGLNSARYHQYEMMAQEIRNALTGNGTQMRQGYSQGLPTAEQLLTEFVNANAAVAAQQAAAQQAAQAAPAAAPAQTAAGTWICPGCGTENSANFCANCGQAKPAPAMPKFCGNCGFRLEAGSAAKFCPGCGKPIA